MKSTWHDLAMWVIAIAGLITGIALFATLQSYDREGRTVATIATSTGLAGIIGLIVLDRIRRS